MDNTILQLQRMMHKAEVTDDEREALTVAIACCIVLRNQRHETIHQAAQAVISKDKGGNVTESPS